MIKRAFIWCILILAIIFAQGCGSDSKEEKNQVELTIFAASSLTESFTEIGQAFEKNHPGVRVKFNFAGSQVLFSQIQNGALADIFAPAGDKYMQQAMKQGLVKSHQPYAGNRMVLAVPAANPQNIKDLKSLTKPCKIVMAEQEVPAGKYTLDVLDHCQALWGREYKNNVLANVISYEPNVKQVIAKILMCEADAGFVYYSDAVEEERRGKLKIIKIPDHLNMKVTYSIGIVHNGMNHDLAEEFTRFLVGAEAQTIFKKYRMNLS